MKALIRMRQRLTALAALGGLLLTFPLLGLSVGWLWEIPGSVFYLFAVWAGVIGLAAWVVERRGRS